MIAFRQSSLALEQCRIYANNIQMQIDNITASSHARSPPRREKIYCDKWIHDGTCAFTQVGCKYKHFMPTDKVTQVSLGLNHGFPNWFRRAQRDGLEGAPTMAALPSLISSSAPENTHPTSRARLDDNWRGGGGVKIGPGVSNITKARTESVQSESPNISSSL